MECPYCGDVLERGTLRSRGGNYFSPQGNKVPILDTKNAMKQSGAIPLPPSAMQLKPDYPTAYACRTCCNIIIPY